MLRLILGIVVAVHPVASVAQAEVWKAMTGPEISAALTGQILDYDDKWQEFHASGRTLYFSGAESWGYWEVRGDQYCSMWPPSDLWACYGMARNGDMVRFTGAAGDTTIGVLRLGDR